MANYTSTHTGAVIDASVTKVSSSGVTQADLSKLNAVTSTAVELNLLDGVTATTAELNILDGVTATAIELNYLDGADSSITTLSLPDNTTITTFGASLIDDADAATARTTLGVDIAGTDNSTDVTLVTTSHDYLSLSGQAITLGQIDISDDTNLVAGDGLALTVDTLSVNVDNSSIETNLDTLRVKALGITNAMLAGSIANSKLSNSSVSYGGVSVALGSSDATPAFNLSDATSLPIVAGTTGTLSVARGGTGAITASGARTNLNVDVAGTDNSTDVTLVTTSHDYLSLTGQAITLGQIDISDDTNLIGGTGITLTGDTLSTTDSEIVHDNLSGFVANEHIDHSGVSITAGAGLTGGGDITATRDIAVGAGTGVTVNADDVAIGQDVATTADVTFNSVTADIIGDIRGATKFSAKADVALNKGDAVYISGVSGTTPTVNIADANDSAKMPSFGLAASSVSINASVEIITFGTLAGINTSAFSVGDIIYISTNGTSGNTLTATAPSGETSLIQNIGKVQRSHATAGSIKVGGAGRSNATPNLNDGNIFIGNGSNQAVTASLNTKIESYLDGGTSTANFDTISVDGAEITATPAELNVLDGITSTTAELNYTDGVTSNIQTQLDAKAPLASPAFTGTATGANLTLSGDLTVNGSTTTLDTTNLAVEDNLMELNAGVTSNANDSGFLIERGTTGDNAIFMWDESADKFTLGTTTATGTTTGDIILSSTGTLVASLEGNVTGDVTGNADTATTLATARNFSLTGDVTAGAVSFDGSGNVALSTTIAANSVALGTDTTGNYMSDLTEGTGIDITHTPAEGSNATIALDLTEVGFGGGANRLITDDGDGTVSTEANLTFDGTNLDLPDSKKVRFGTGNDLEIYHDGINSVINNTTGDLQIYNNADDKDVVLLSDDGIGGTTAYITLDGSATQITNHKLTNFNQDIYLADDETLFVGTDTANGLRLFHLSSNNNNYVRSNGGALSVETIAAQPIYFNTNSTSAMAIDSSQRVGIGTTSPGEKLTIKAGGDTSQEVIKIRNSSNTEILSLGIDGSGDGYLNFNSSPAVINTNGGHLALTPGGSGNVGIGTSSPSTNLEVSDSANGGGVDIVVANTYYASSSTDEFVAFQGEFYQNDVSANRAGGYIRFVKEGDFSNNSNASSSMFFATRNAGTLAERMRITSAGNVGIGTSSPGAKLEITGSNDTTNMIIGAPTHLVGGGSLSEHQSLLFDNTNVSGASGQVLLRHYANSHNDSEGALAILTTSTAGTTAEAMRIRGSGNVGIGTDSPDSKLQVEYTTTSNGSAAIAEFGTSGSGSIAGSAHQVIVGGPSVSDYTGIQIFSDTTTGKGVLSFADGRGANDNWRGVVQYDHSSNDMEFWTDAAERMKIDSSGNVGIGTSSPQRKLHVSTGDTSIAARFENTTSNGTVAEFISSGDSRTLTIQTDHIYSNGSLFFGLGNYTNTYRAGTHIFQEDTGNTEVMRITGNNVGIGTNSPGYKLDVAGQGKVTNGWLVDNGTTAGFFTTDSDNVNFGASTSGKGLKLYSANAEAMRINSSGNVLIGTSNTGWDGDADNLVVGSGSGNNGMTIYAGSTSFSQINFADSNSGAGRYTGVVRYNHNTNDMSFHTNDGAVAMTIDAQRNLKFADNGTNPSASANIAYLFNDGGELKVLDELGNTTTISPHNFSLIPGGASEDRAWGYYSEKDIVDDEGNVTATQKVNVDMMKLARLVEELTGEKLVYTEED